MAADSSAGARNYDVYALKLRWRLEPAALGRRDLTKLQTLSRISSGARTHFSRKGYDVTTLHDVASHAGVAPATMAFYVHSKQDLVVLLFNELLAGPIETALDDHHADLALGALVRVVAPIYDACVADVGLFRILFRENMFHAETHHVREATRLRAVLVDRLATRLRARQARGELNEGLDARFAARAAFLLLFTSLRWWIAHERPVVEDGLAALRRMLALLVDGMGDGVGSEESGSSCG